MEDNYEILEDQFPRKRKNSKVKGNSFERKVCKILNEHFQTNEFCRSPGSGAFANTHNLPAQFRVYGDLLVPEKFNYSIEVKKGYNEIKVSDIFDKKSKLWMFIRQSKSDANKANKKWIVIWQQDRTKTMCICDRNDFSYIEEKDRLNYDEFSIILLDLVLHQVPKTEFYTK